MMDPMSTTKTGTETDPMQISFACPEERPLTQGKVEEVATQVTRESPTFNREGRQFSVLSSREQEENQTMDLLRGSSLDETKLVVGTFSPEQVLDCFSQAVSELDFGTAFKILGFENEVVLNFCNYKSNPFWQTIEKENVLFFLADVARDCLEANRVITILQSIEREYGKKYFNDKPPAGSLLRDYYKSVIPAGVAGERIGEIVSRLSQLVLGFGKSIDDVKELSADEMENYLETLSPGQKLDCFLAAIDRFDFPTAFKIMGSRSTEILDEFGFNINPDWQTLKKENVLFFLVDAAPNSPEVLEVVDSLLELERKSGEEYFNKVSRERSLLEYSCRFAKSVFSRYCFENMIGVNNEELKEIAPKLLQLALGVNPYMMYEDKNLIALIKGLLKLDFTIIPGNKMQTIYELPQNPIENIIQSILLLKNCPNEENEGNIAEFTKILDDILKKSLEG